MRVKLILPLLVLTLACGKKEAAAPPPAPAAPAAPPAPAPIAVKTISLGSAIGADKKVAQASDAFSAKDTIYASVETDGVADKASLQAKWTFAGSKGPIPVHDETMNLVAVTGPAVNEFHVSKKTGWPKGAYQVEVLLNGASAGKKDFTVK